MDQPYQFNEYEAAPTMDLDELERRADRTWHLDGGPFISIKEFRALLALARERDAARDRLTKIAAAVEPLPDTDTRTWTGSLVEAVKATVQRAEAADTRVAQMRAVIEAADRVGKWLSAALDDRDVCEEMKADIGILFIALAKVDALAALDEAEKGEGMFKVTEALRTDDEAAP